MARGARLVRRAAHAVAVVWVACTIGFVVLRAMPGDPLGASAEQSGRSSEARERLRQQHGLNDGLFTQYTRYFASIARGNFGTSITEQRPVVDILAPALGNSALLCGTALVLALLLGMSVGVLQGWNPSSTAGRMLGQGTVALYAVPEFVLAVLLLGIFAVQLRWFPVGGIGDPLVQVTGGTMERAADRLRHLVLPACTLAIGWGAMIARQQRVALLHIAHTDFVRTAHAKGVSSRNVLMRHALPHSLAGVVATLNLMLPVIASGAVVVETLFSWPGTGTLMVRSIVARDYPVVSGGIVAIAMVVAIGSFLTEVVARALNPEHAVDNR